MNQYKISVIVPMYNLKKYIRRCLNSLIKQDIKVNYEIIVIDNGSSDGSGKLVEPYLIKYPFIKMITQENQGVSGARNTGLKHASGTYLVFVDGDDFVDKQYLSKMYDMMIRKQCDIVCCSYYNYFENSKKQMKSILVHQEEVLPSHIAMKQLLHDLTIRSYLWNKMFKRSLFEEGNIFFGTLNYFEDFELMPKLFYYASNIGFIHDSLYYYVQREGSAMHTNSYQKLEQYVIALKKIKAFLIEKKLFPKVENDFRFLCLKVALSIVMMGITNVSPLLKEIKHL